MYEPEFLITSKEVMILVAIVCLFVSNISQKSYEQIVMKFYDEVQGGTINK